MTQTPPEGVAVTPENWQTAEHLGWAFQHVADLFPTVAISRGLAPIAPLGALASGALAAGLGQVGVPDAVADLPVVMASDGVSTTVAAVMATTWTDGWIVLRDGQVIAEDYPTGMAPATLHLLMSVSKSLVGCVAGTLAAHGILDVEREVSTYLPELVGTGYAGATARQLLDMRSGIQFSEAYLDPTAEVRVLEEAIGWAPRRSPAVPDGMHAFLKSLRQKGPHGGPFEYRSCETDLLGWVCEAAAGVPMSQLMSELLWARLGCEFDANLGVDSFGAGMFDGGVSCALRDLARFGAMIQRGGVSLTGEQVIPESWVQDSYVGGLDSREAFALSPGDNRMPGGMYRNQFWIPYAAGNVLLCLGIHGQMVYVNPAARLVAAKVSSWPTPQDAPALFATLAAFDAIAAIGLG